MSVYVTSDLHGYPLNKLQNKLGEIGFDIDDHLYILGDCIDRGSEGLQLLRWIMSQPNVTFLLGNHDRWDTKTIGYNTLTFDLITNTVK